MSSVDPYPVIRPGRLPFHRHLAHFAASCWIGTLATDAAYCLTADILWADFSTWLLTVGVVIGWIALVVGIIEFIASRFVRASVRLWPHALGQLVALILATLNMLIHTRDAWTSVVPWGIGLSVLTVLIMLLTGWLGASRAYPPRLGAPA